MECFAYAGPETYDLQRLKNLLSNEHPSTILAEALHLKTEEGDLFFFTYGTCVTWNVSPEAFGRIIAPLPADMKSSDVASDQFNYSYGEKSLLQEDEIILESRSFEAKLAASYAVSQSIKLEMFEQKIERSIEESRFLPEEMAHKGKIPLNRRSLARMMGRLFLERSSVNFHTDILDLPDYFWEHTEMEPFYLRMRRYLNLDQRTDVLNKRLGLIHEMLDMLGDELGHRQSARLEWIIIILILIEVIILFVKDIFHVI